MNARHRPSEQQDGPPLPDPAPSAAGVVVRVAAPSRLHFGLLSFGGSGEQRQYGGVGAMIRRPGLRLTLRRAEGLVVVGPLAERAAGFARRFADATGVGGELGCRIVIEAAPQQHVGLGTGTQLGLAVVAGLATLFGKPLREPESLARVAGRGARSAIGAHGFVRGGLLLERGKLPQEAISALSKRVALPQLWRFALFRLRAESGLSGGLEQEAFSRLEAVPSATSERLLRLAVEDLLPAAARADFPAFSESLYRYGHEAGMCFAKQQAGAFASPALAELVGQLRSLGIDGVGQSSWGPTIYAVLESQSAAEELFAEFRTSPRADGVDCTITAPDNEGAQIESQA